MLRDKSLNRSTAELFELNILVRRKGFHESRFSHYLTENPIRSFSISLHNDPTEIDAKRAIRTTKTKEEKRLLVMNQEQVELFPYDVSK